MTDDVEEWKAHARKWERRYKALRQRLNVSVSEMTALADHLDELAELLEKDEQ